MEEVEDYPGDDPLSCTTRNILMMFARADLSCNLRVLGSQLGLDTFHLDEIESLPYGQRRVEMLEKCFNLQQLSWTLLATSLRSQALKEYSVADYIERHCLHDHTTSDSSSTQQPSLLRSLSMSSPESSSSAETDMTIPNVVNEIADVSNWQELGIILGLGAIDIERIASDYEPREYRQRLVETWFTRDPHRSWEKLRRSRAEAAARRSSLISQRSIPSTPTSPMDVDEYDGRESSLSLSSAPGSTPTSPMDTETQIEEFERRFTNILIATRKELEKKDDAVDLVKDKVTAMPLVEHLKVISAIARRKKPFNNLTEFFAHLTVHCWNFFEYHPLKQLILNTCSVKLKSEIKTYARDIQTFQKRTTIAEFIRCRRHLAKKRSIPKRFKKLANEHNIDPDNYSLADLESFRQDTCRQIKLSDFALQVYSITSKCILVEWLIPDEIVELLSLFYSSKEGEELLQRHGVDKVFIDGRTLQSWLLLACVKTGECERAQSILREEYADLDINCHDHESNRTALFHAAVMKYTDLLKNLLERGADINTSDNEGKTTLMAAVESGHEDVVKVLLDPVYQCDTNVQECALGWSALHFAVASGRLDIVELLNNPILHTDITISDKNGRTAVQIAQEKQHSQIIEILSPEVEPDIDPTGEHDEGEHDEGEGHTATDREEATEVGATPTETSTKKPKSAGASKSRIKKILLRISWPPTRKKNALIQATKKGSIVEVMKLLDGGHDPNLCEESKSQWTPLLYASDRGHKEIVQLLLEKGGNPNYSSADEGYTALILAGYMGYVEILKMLLDYGAEVNAQTTVTLQTSLQRVCLYTPARYKSAKHPPSERRCEVIQLLLRYGADIKLLDEQNRTPLIAASRSGFPGIVKILLDEVKNFPAEERQQYLDHEMRHSWTALMEASEAGHVDIVRMLINAGASIKQKKKDNVTALHIAVHHRHTAVIKELVKTQDKELLNSRDHYGLTPLILATKDKNEEVISILLHAGADLDLQTNDADKMTALMYAVKNGAKDVIKILVKHKANLLIRDAKERTASDMAKSAAIRRFLHEIQEEQRQVVQSSQSQQLQTAV